jgi:hypothetical protein
MGSLGINLGAAGGVHMWQNSPLLLKLSQLTVHWILPAPQKHQMTSFLELRRILLTTGTDLFQTCGFSPGELTAYDIPALQNVLFFQPGEVLAKNM